MLRYYQACRKYPLLSKEQEQELSRRVCEDGDLSARNELVCHNLRLVRSVARRYAWSKLPFADLIQEGNLGLITAAEKFDWRVGTRFTTYAYWWIRQAVTRAILQYSDVIRLPVHIGMLRLNILQAIDRMCIDGGRIPTPEAIAEYLDTPLPAVKNALRAMHLQNPIPLDGIPRSGEEGDEINLQDLVADPNGADPSVILEAKQELLAIYNDLRIILDAIKELPGNRERNITVFKEMHGLGPSGEKRTLEEVGQEFGVTRERIRQILLRIFESLAEQGIEVDQQALRDHLWRVQELEKLSGTLFAELD
ncbi:MAG TPA: RNA polymerase sigma factor RpoD/SigA [Candidatus Paceibacterota bacterium]|nr:RNA polymerase sigma factor RpoD/SigA [Candidatus Paceibacterota bacterium]